MVELLVVVAGLAVVGGGGYVTISGVTQMAKESKLENDVGVVNRAVDAYLAGGGSFTGNEDAEGIVAKLKTVAANSSQMMGLRGAMLDSRIVPIMQEGGEQGTEQLRAVPVWDAGRGAWYFRVGKPSTGLSDSGVKEFRLNEEMAMVAEVSEARDTTKVAAETGWHWGWTNIAQADRPVGWSPTIGLEDALSQNFGNPPWTVGPTGQVDVSYLYRGAGYTNRLALVSLEGMGSANYNLDDPEDQRQFLMELLRRVIDEDRAQTIIDASSDRPTADTNTNQDNVVRDKTFEFRPGDTVAALMIPNGTFEDAIEMLEAMGDISDNPDALYDLARNQGEYNQDWVEAATGRRTSASQLFAVTSLSRTNTETGSNFPFYEEKFAAIGENTDTYALEDLIVNSDQDYEDIVFKAVGLQATGTFKNVVTDPYTYYTEKGRWDSAEYGADITLGEALIEAGVVDPDTVP